MQSSLANSHHSMGGSTARSLEEQLELWSELAKTLEGRLHRQTTEVEKWKRRVAETEATNQDLKDECKYKTGRIADLEQQCSARSSKLSQLAQIMTSKKTNAAEEKLVQATLKVAELEEQHKLLKRANDELSGELDEANVAMSNMRKDREKNNRLLLELSDMIRTLNRIAIDYEKIGGGDKGDGSSGQNPSSNNINVDPQDQSLKNVKRKIEAIDHDRQRLLRERDALQEERDALHEERDTLREEMATMQAKITAFEASFQSINKSRSRCSSSTCSESKDPSPPPPESFKERQCSIAKKTSRSNNDNNKPRNKKTTRSIDDFDAVAAERSVASVASVSSSSSFSTLDPPPTKKTVSLKEYEELKTAHQRALQKNQRIIDKQNQVKRDFDKALDVIEKLRCELSKRKSSLQSMEKTKSLADDLQRDLNQALDGMANLDSQVRDLQIRLTDTRKAHEEALQNNSVLKRESDARIAEMAELHEHLQQQYHDLELEYSMKIEMLETRLVDAQKEQERVLAEEKKACQERLDAAAMEGKAALDVQRKMQDDLKHEYDTFLEIHLKAEDEAKAGEKRYQEAMAKIVTLESQLLESKEAMGRDALEHQENLSKSKRAIQETARKFQKMKKDYNAALKENENTKREAADKQSEMKRGYESSIANHRRMQHDAIRSYKELRKEFDAALIDHGKKEQEALQRYQHVKEELETAKRQHQRAVTELLQSSQQTSAETNEALEKEWKKRLEQVQLDSQRQLEQVESELRQQLKALKTESKQQLDHLESNNQQLHVTVKSREDMTGKYNQLSSSYTCALTKIESLVKELLKRSVGKPMASVGKPVARRGRSPTRGRVSERIKHFEKKNTKADEKTEPVAKTSEADSTFQQDFAAILQRLGHDETSLTEPATEHDESSTSYSSVSISLDTIITPKAVKKEPCPKMFAKICEAGVQTDISGGQPFASELYFEIRHVLLWSQVNEAFRRQPRFADMPTSSVGIGLIEPEHLARLLQHIQRLRKVQESLTKRNMTQSENSKAHDINATVEKGGGSTSAKEDTGPLKSKKTSISVGKANMEVERLQGEQLRHKVHLNAATIKSQARAKDFRLLELQYKNLREQYDEAVQEKNPRPHHCPTVVHRPSPDEGEEDGSCKLHPAVSSLTSDPRRSDRAPQADGLKQQLIEAEKKLVTTKRELQACNSRLDVARKEHEQEDESFKHAMERIRVNDSWSDVLPPPAVADSTDENSIGETVDPEDDQAAAHVGRDDQAGSISSQSDQTAVIRGDHPSFESSEPSSENRFHSPVNSYMETPSSEIQSISTGKTSSLEGVLIDDATSSVLSSPQPYAQRYLQLPSSRASGVLTDPHRIDQIQLELRRAKEAAEIARTKQKEREDNLRDVIFQYKALKREHDELAEAMRKATAKKRRDLEEEKKEEVASTVSGAPSDLSETVIVQLKQELEEGHHKMSEMEYQMERAQLSAQQARNAQSEQQQNLRGVIDEYKRLQDEFMILLDQKKELEKTLQVQQRRDDAAGSISYLPSNLSCVDSSRGIHVPQTAKKAVARTTKFYREAILAPLQEMDCDDISTACGGDIWNVLQRDDDEDDDNQDQDVVYQPTQQVLSKSIPPSEKDHRGNLRSANASAVATSKATAASSNEVLHVGNVRTRIEMFESSHQPQPPPPSAPSLMIMATTATTKKKKGLLAKGLFRRGKGLIVGSLPLSNNNSGSNKSKE